MRHLRPKKALCYRNSSVSIPRTYADIHFAIRLIQKRKLAKDLCPPLDGCCDSDTFTILVGEETFVVSAHRLMEVSPVFRAMLTNEMVEKSSRKVEVKDAEPEHFRAFLEMVNPGQDVRPNHTSVVGLLKLAERYQVSFVKELCEEHLLDYCFEMPLIERLQLADTYGFEKLKNNILSIGTEQLRNFYKANADELQEEGRFSKKLMAELVLRLC